MTPEEETIIQYLKDNLTINIQQRHELYSTNCIEVSIQLEGQEISSDSMELTVEKEY